VKRLILVGGGHTHVEVLRRFGMQPLAGVELLLISPGRFTPYSGMLPGLVAGHYGFEECHIDLEALTNFARARFLRDQTVGLDPEAKSLRCESGVSVPYDVLSIDIGAVPARYPKGRHPQGDSTGVGIPVKPVDRYLQEWERVLQLARQRPLDLLVVGGGAGGVEITLAMQHRLSRLTPRPSVRFSLVTMTDTIMPDHCAGVRKRLARVLAQRGVAVHLRSRVVKQEADGVLLESGAHLQADCVFSALGARPPAWLAQAGLKTDAAGFVLVGETLQSLSHPEVFAVGDVATMARHPRPKSGVYAVRQGPPLADNLRRLAGGQVLEPYLPQPIALNLISTGDKYAVASWGSLAWEGAWVWRWKDRIDRRFMRRYRFGAAGTRPGSGAGFMR
jgi:selenide,water dikinase